MRTEHTGAFALASALIAFAGLASDARADVKPQKEKQVERVVIKAQANADSSSESQRRIIGVTIRNVDEALATHLGLNPKRSLIIDALETDGPAARAGLRVHDLIVGVNGESGCSISELSKAVDSAGDEGAIRLRVRRAGDEQVIIVKPEVAATRAEELVEAKAGSNAFFMRLDSDGVKFSPRESQVFRAQSWGFSDDGAGFVFKPDDNDSGKATFERYSQSRQALEALAKLEGLLESVNAGSDAADALKQLRGALRATGGQWSADFTLPQVEFLWHQRDDEEEDEEGVKIKTQFRIDTDIDAKSKVKTKSMYIPSIELDELKVVVDEKGDGRFVKAITVGPKDAKAFTLQGVVSDQLEVAKALQLGDGQLRVGAGELSGVKLGGAAGGFAVLKALEDVRAGAADCDDDSVRSHLRQIEKQLDRIEKLLTRMLDAIE